MKKLNVLVACLFFLLLITSCSYDNEEEFYNTDECDISAVTFSETIDPIIDRNCKVCHYSGNATGVTLETYDNILEEALEGKLLGVIKHAPGYEPMPKGGKLDDCSILKIETWINDGSPNN